MVVFVCAVSRLYSVTHTMHVLDTSAYSHYADSTLAGTSMPTGSSGAEPPGEDRLSGDTHARPPRPRVSEYLARLVASPAGLA